MASDVIGGGASSLLAPVFDGDSVDLVEVVRTTLSVHYETGNESVPVICVCRPGAVRLPNALVTERLPHAGRARIHHRHLVTAADTWRVASWWLPARPQGLLPPQVDLTDHFPPESALSSWGVPALRASYDGLAPATLIGAGPGLTPTGDDLLAGALVTAHATADPRLGSWRRSVRQLLSPGRTSAVSRAMLHHALDGYATPQLSDYVHAVCDEAVDPGRLDRATARLLGLGHSSGAALMTGVLHTLTTNRMRGAA